MAILLSSLALTPLSGINSPINDPEPSSTTVIVDSSIAPSTPIIYAKDLTDGIATRSASWSTCTAPGGMQVTCKGGVGIFGHPGYRASYRWGTSWFSSSSALVNVRGFNTAGRATWYGAGMGASGGATVNWGNVLAEKMVRVRSLNPPAGVSIWFE